MSRSRVYKCEIHVPEGVARVQEYIGGLVVPDGQVKDDVAVNVIESQGVEEFDAKDWWAESDKVAPVAVFGIVPYVVVGVELIADQASRVGRDRESWTEVAVRNEMETVVARLEEIAEDVREDFSRKFEKVAGFFVLATCLDLAGSVGSPGPFRNLRILDCAQSACFVADDGRRFSSTDKGSNSSCRESRAAS